MKNKFKFLLSTVVMSFVMVGCGGGGSSSADAVSSTAKDILLGNTFYYTDDDIYDNTGDDAGYYSNTFTSSSLIEEEHTSDSEANSIETFSATYSGDNLNVIIEDTPMSCSVKRLETSVLITCSSGYEERLWDTIEDAKAYYRSSADAVSSTAKDILLGNTFYYTDDDIYDNTGDDAGYYSNTFTSSSLIEKAHRSDAEVVNSDTFSATYSGDNLNVIIEDTPMSCSVKRLETSVLITCPYGYEERLWDTIEDAKAHPEVDNSTIKTLTAHLF